MKLIYYVKCGSLAIPSDWMADGSVRVKSGYLASAVLYPGFNTFKVLKVPTTVFQEWIRGAPEVSMNASFIKGATVKDLAAWCLQRAWRLAISCPEFAVCRRRLMREAKELENM